MSADNPLVGAINRLAAAVEALLPAVASAAPATEWRAEPHDWRSARLMRLAKLEHEMREMDAGDRAAAIQERMRMSSSTYYRERTAAIESGLFPLVPKNGKEGGNLDR